MEKISRILPSNARLATVDLKNSGTARSGSPGFGRMQGVSSVAERQMIADTAQIADGLNTAQMQKRNTTEDKHVQMIQKMADQFFVNRAQREAEIANVSLPSSDNRSDMTIEVAPVEIAPAEGESADGSGETPVKGSQLDVQA